MDLLLAAVLLALLLAGVPVAFALAGSAVAVAGLGMATGTFDPFLLRALPGRVLGVAESDTLIAIPLFVLMGTVLERSGLAADLVRAVAHVLRGVPGGMPVAVTLVGLVLAAATGVVGASVVALGLIALPPMLAAGIAPARATGTVAAAGTLGQIVPPAIVLVVLADQIAAAYSQAQTRGGGFAADTVTVGDLFAGALVPGLLLAAAYVAWQMVRGGAVVAVEPPARPGSALLAPLLLILLVLGSILLGLASVSEAASLGALGAMALAARALPATLRPALAEAARLTAIIFAIVIGASVFSLVFRGLGGDARIEAWLAALPGGTWGALALVLATVFLLGFVLEFIEITVVIVPLVAPALLIDPAVSPVWLGILLALVLQTSFLTPPFGVALFYLRSVMPADVPTAALYRGVWPFVALQLLVVALVLAVPALATWLPSVLR